MLAKKPKGATEKRKTSSVSGLLWMFVGAVLTLMIGVFLYLSPLFDFSPADKTVSDPNKQVQPRVNTDTDNSDYEFYDILPSQEMPTIPDEDLGVAEDNPVGNVSDFEPDVVIRQSEGNRNEDSGNFGISENTVIEPSRGNNTTNSNSDDNIVIVEEDATYDGAPTTSSNNSGSQGRTNSAGSVSVQKAQPATTYILQINSFGNADEADRRRAQVLMAGVDAKVVKNATPNGAPIYQVISRPMNNRQSVTTAQQRLQNNGIDSIIVEQRR
ncbi:SPOR domain-containing protein [Psychrobacter frigidicola]|uniref:SPOR domain-containing protein n=1 Tax=Psychrobacter frigidicola TaxID=45611 RepID=A0A5C6ZZ16_9GAMM|nr:SPOR domain-containing protein [Psychrobacter frigidicola]TXD96068.1 SPOR domain-containing protein [Psychrobacter frigidicola]